MAKPIYSNEDMQKALRYVAETLGHVPSIKEYEHVREQEMFAHMDAKPDDIEAITNGEKSFWMPTVVTLRSRYRNWGGAVAEIKDDFPNNFKKEDLVHLEYFIKESGRSVTEKEYEDFCKMNTEAPTAAALIKRFKNWSGVLRAAGSTPTHYRYWKDEELIEMMLELGVSIGRMPTVAEYDRAAKANNWPVSRQFYRRFGPFRTVMMDGEEKEVRYDQWGTVESLIASRLNNAVSKRGYAPSQSTVKMFVKERSTKEQKVQNDLNYIAELAQRLQRCPTIQEYSKAQIGTAWPTAEQIKKSNNGSWRQACTNAGINDGFVLRSLTV